MKHSFISPICLACSMLVAKVHAAIDMVHSAFDMVVGMLPNMIDASAVRLLDNGHPRSIFETRRMGLA